MIAISRTDTWAVGGCTLGTDQRPFSVHWDGASWDVVLAPFRRNSSTLFSVDAVTAHDVWTVGTSTEARTGLLTEHSFGC